MYDIKFNKIKKKASQTKLNRNKKYEGVIINDVFLGSNALKKEDCFLFNNL